ncbi:MAG: preprotein translocase subunit SecE [Oscillospiraceae bacterium]
MSKAKNDAVKKTTIPVKKPDDKAKKGFFGGIAQWFRELKAELKKVVWPTKAQVANNTIVALVVMLFSAVVLWGFDTVAQMGVKALISLVG